ncbi:MAG: hypothetical protein NVSMB31_14930 [Vulcanimicrobiaceae bacterium]
MFKVSAALVFFPVLLVVGASSSDAQRIRTDTAPPVYTITAKDLQEIPFQVNGKTHHFEDLLLAKPGAHVTTAVWGNDPNPRLDGFSFNNSPIVPNSGFVGGNSFVYTITSDMLLQLQNPQHQNVGEPIHLPIGAPAPVAVAPGSILLPTVIQQGDAFAIGLPPRQQSNASLSIDGKPIPKVAESEEWVVGQDDTPGSGLRIVTVLHGNKTYTHTVFKINVDLSADKTKLQRGETTQLHIVITGLLGVPGPLQMVVQNNSPETIGLSGITGKEVSIPMEAAKGGTYRTDRTITGVKPGGFNVMVHVFAPSQTVKAD